MDIDDIETPCPICQSQPGSNCERCAFQRKSSDSSKHKFWKREDCFDFEGALCMYGWGRWSNMFDMIRNDQRKIVLHPTDMPLEESGGRQVKNKKDVHLLSRAIIKSAIELYKRNDVDFFKKLLEDDKEVQEIDEDVQEVDEETKLEYFYVTRLDAKNLLEKIKYIKYYANISIFITSDLLMGDPSLNNTDPC